MQPIVLVRQYFDLHFPHDECQIPRRVNSRARDAPTMNWSVYVSDMIFVTVIVTGSLPDMVVVDLAHPKTDEQKLVRDAVLDLVV